MKKIVSVLALLLSLFGSAAVQAEVLKPYIMGNTPPGSVKQVAESVKNALKAQGFDLVGTYEPFAGAMVICATNPELKAAAAKVENGGFGVAQRVSVTEVNGKIQVAYANPAYIGTAYGLGKLEGVSAKLKAALGARESFGSVGLDEERLKPGVYRYAFMMPYFHDVDLLKEHPDYKTAVDTVEKNLAAGAGGTVKVYRVDLPGKEVSVFGVGIPKGAVDGPDKGDKDTDKEILGVVDHQELKHTAYLPYEVMVVGGKVIALRARYRIALHFPDTKMAGAHGFTKIMSAPWGILVALERVAGFQRNI
ncbi:hypothetical protein SVA_2988 [Sulfurifustis variabilis]|uniref:Uncharacterized protein n=1 Tax=Sulfurifustis variabilis TaxID=1675686 RepID=A0A1B4V7P2_9GAMM|nr:hypothetical protein [Sulfurifustis variabilis]BAU49536.1 hypothetical protein SVA_2988 [Sulfurifustis variabilis]